RARRTVPDAFGDIADRQFLAPQQMLRDGHTPGEHIFHWRDANDQSHSSAAVRHGSDGRNVDDVTEREGEETDEDQTDQRARRRPGKGPAFLYGSAGLRDEDRLQQRP